MRVFPIALFLALMPFSPADAISLQQYFSTLAGARVAEQIAGEEKPTWGAWKKLCFPRDAKGQPEPEEPSSENPAICFTHIELIADSVWPLFMFGVLQVPETGRNYVLFLLPQWAPEGMKKLSSKYVQLDSSERIGLEPLESKPIDLTSRFGDYSRADISQLILDRMKAAKAMALSLGDKVSPPLPVPTDGFAKVLDGPPEHPNRRADDDQMWLRIAVRN